MKSGKRGQGGIAYRGGFPRGRTLPALSESKPIDYFPFLFGDDERNRFGGSAPAGEE
jgi:hypothetical protein